MSKAKQERAKDQRGQRGGQKEGQEGHEVLEGASNTAAPTQTLWSLLTPISFCPHEA